MSAAALNALIIGLYIFILAVFLGYQLISRVPPLLHTPLMSLTNAISGISLVGSMVAAGSHHGTITTVLGTVAVAAASINVFGGFLITDRMLKMFRKGPAGAPQGPPMTTEVGIQFLYLGGAVCFILSLLAMNKASTARLGVFAAELGMLLAIVGMLLHQRIVTYEWIVLGLVIGATIGGAISLKIPMTKMPERIALSHAFGGLAVALVGISEYYSTFRLGLHGGTMNPLQIGATAAEVALGSLTFTGSLMAFGKLQGILSGKPLTYGGQNALDLALIAATVVAAAVLIARPDTEVVFYGVLVAGLLLGVLLVLPIGGADMPVVICLLNSYAGLAACAAGFAIGNNVLIICGALDGGSGFVLGLIMSKAMNRSFRNVVFGAFGAAPEASAAPALIGGRAPTVASVEEAAEVLGAATSLIVVPGYGMAVSQAQHAMRDLANVLKARDCQVRYAIHPVAGRMPGHMNVLLAEAEVPYDELFDLDEINDDFVQTDVALVVGANDVVNPAATDDRSSPIYGMPVFHVLKARTVIVLKRSLNPGFAGIDNLLFVKENTLMVLGDAEKTLQGVAGELKRG